MRGDYLNQESLFQKSGSVFSVPKREDCRIGSAQFDLPAVLWGYVCLINKDHPGKKLRQWTSECPHARSTSHSEFDMDQPNQHCPRQNLIVVWMTPALGEGKTEPDPLHCLYHHPRCLWMPRLSCFSPRNMPSASYYKITTLVDPVIGAKVHILEWLSM